ncbi:hypothetical protein FS749_006573 [Ceratobasidium sp. UAMH 11750]|nr:hypothetical protein FS749_006573 [Ceratobasidium sp. UAMH 11750]
MFQKVFEDRYTSDFEDSEQEDDTDSTTSDLGTTEPITDGLGTDELGAEELEELEEELDLLMLTKPCPQTLEFNLNLDLDPISSNRYHITTLLLPSNPVTQHYLYHLHGLQELLP